MALLLSRDGAVWQPRAPPCGHCWDCIFRRTPTLKLRRPVDLRFPRGCRPHPSLAWLNAMPTRVPTSVLPSPQPQNPPRAEVR